MKLIESLRRYFTDEALGLLCFNPTKNKFDWVHPARSDRVFVDDSPTFGAKPRPRPANGFFPTAMPGGPPRTLLAAPESLIKPGDHLLLVVLETLPGRPIAGEKIVRPDGTVSLGFYGDLKVAGMTRGEAKIKLIEHLRQQLSDEALGLVEVDKEGNKVAVLPEHSTHVLVDEVQANEAPDTRIDALEKKLDRVLEELQTLKKGRPQ